MDQFSLECFSSVVNHKSFTKAAADMHVVQSTISKQIAQLEKELGVQLFYRDRHSVALTQEGQRLAADVQVYINQYRSINEGLHTLMLDFTRKLRIGVGLFEFFMAEAPLALFSRRCPEVAVSYMHYSYSRLVSHCRTGVVEVNIGNEHCLRAVPNIASYRIAKEPLLVAAHRDNLFWKLSPERRAVLDDQLVITTYSNEYEPVRPYCIQRGFLQSGFTYSNSYFTQLSMLKANIGVALLPASFAAQLPEPIRFENTFEEPMYVRHYLLYNAHSLNPAVAEFVACCREACPGGDEPDDDPPAPN